MKIKVQEFIDAENHENLIHGDDHISQSEIKSKSTTDQVVSATRQPVDIANYRRFPTEASLPFNEQADAMATEPEKFYEFLREKSMEDTFEAYFVEDKSFLKNKLKEAALANALKMAEQILNHKNTETDVLDKNIPTIEELKEREGLIITKLEKIGEYCKSHLSPQEKKLIINHFNRIING